MKSRMQSFLVSILLCVCFLGMSINLAHAQATTISKQINDSAPVQPMSAAELAQLNDPFFNLVLKGKPNETNLAEIEKLLQPDLNKREVFVVDEAILNPSLNQLRRSVLTFTGTNQGEFLNSNVMLSVSFGSDRFSDTPESIEAWGWDDRGSRYNYYSLDSEGGSLTWKFRGSSLNADTVSASARQGTCLQCHVNGAPIMKELFLPWNNWHSNLVNVTYLQPGFPNSWPVATSPRLARLGNAYNFETEIIAPIRQFNTRRIDALVPNNQVTDAKRLLKPLFETTEFNIISSRQTSNLHPFSPSSPPTTAKIQIPNSFFLNAELIAGGGPAQYQGLEISAARSFLNAIEVSPQEYDQLVRNAQVKLNGKRPGDTNFAWFVPEASHIDNDFVDQLLKKGLVPREFIAAALAVDLEKPVFSADRKRLLSVIPAQFQVKPTNDLIPQTITRLQQLNPPENSPEGQFLQNLQNPDPVALLTTKVQDYLSREKNLLGNPSTRTTELNRLYAVAVQRRQAVLADPVLSSLDETKTSGLLFPLP